MTIGILKVSLFIQDSNSLKEKRMVLERLKNKLRSNFNVSLTQLEDQDKWQKANLAIVGVEKNNQMMNNALSRIVNYLEAFNQIDLIDYAIELI